jgi:hypothetical protein
MRRIGSTELRRSLLDPEGDRTKCHVRSNSSLHADSKTGRGLTMFQPCVGARQPEGLTIECMTRANRWQWRNGIGSGSRHPPSA